jgi:hypothetical protein
MFALLCEGDVAASTDWPTMTLPRTALLSADDFNCLQLSPTVSMPEQVLT